MQESYVYFMIQLLEPMFNKFNWQARLAFDRNPRTMTSYPIILFPYTKLLLLPEQKSKIIGERTHYLCLARFFEPFG